MSTDHKAVLLDMNFRKRKQKRAPTDASDKLETFPERDSSGLELFP